jgi:type I restriction enzyme S subunit
MAVEFFSNPSGVPNVPNGWNVAAIENLCSRVTSGATPLRSNAEYYDAGTIPWIRTQELKDGIIRESAQKITPAALKETSAKLFPVDTVLMAMYGDGKTITSLGILGIEAATNQACCAMITDPTRCLPRFLFYNLRHHRDDIIHIATGGAQRNLSGAIIRRFAISVPPLDEQAVITGILGTLDDKIEQNRKMNETLEAMARALFKSWFVDFDPVRAKAEGRDPGLPVHIVALFPDSFEDSEIGEIPTGWSVLGLDDTARFLNGLAMQKFPPKGDRFLPVIKISQLRAGDMTGADKASADLAPEYVVEDGDVLFSWSGSLECVLWPGGRGALNQHLFKVTSEEFPKWFYFLWIHQHLDDFRQIAAGKATTMGHIQRHHLSAAKVVVPPALLLKEMSRHLAPLIDQIVQFKCESKALAAARDLLLPKLISGELRLDVVESNAGECA